MPPFPNKTKRQGKESLGLGLCKRRRSVFENYDSHEDYKFNRISKRYLKGSEAEAKNPEKPGFFKRLFGIKKTEKNENKNHNEER